MTHHLSISNYRFSGTIVGIEDNNSSGWVDSEWRSLKVNLFSCDTHHLGLVQECI